MAKEKY